MRTMVISMYEKGNKFCILNSEVMKKWIAKYDKERKKRDPDCQIFRQNHATNRLPHPLELSQVPEFPSGGRWLDQAVEEARRNGETISD